MEKRNQLLAELEGLEGFEIVAQWAKRIIPDKNTLTCEDADSIGTALEAKLQRFECYFEDGVVPATPSSTATRPPRSRHAQENDARESRPPGEWLATADRSTLAFGHAPRRRNKAHLKFVGSQPCLVCNRQPADAHHLKFAQPTALGRKVSDEYTVPLCRTHHRQLHQAGNEVEWWKSVGNVEPLVVARTLWEQSHAGGDRPNIQRQV